MIMRTKLGRVMEELACFYSRNGCVRRQNRDRLSQEGYVAYKKGDELRLAASNSEELARLRRLLTQAGFRPGRPFAKGRQQIQPVYGREAVRRFLELMAGRSGEPAAHPAAPRRAPARRRKHARARA